MKQSPVMTQAISGIAEVVAGQDLPKLIADTLVNHPQIGFLSAGLTSGDIICIASKIVSKALGNTIPPDRKEDVVRKHATGLIARRQGPSRITSVVATDYGPVMAAAGIDASNTGGEQLLVLPDQPDSMAQAIRNGLRNQLGVNVGVVLTDSISRPWRDGITDIALGAAGIQVIDDQRGEKDRSGRTMSVTRRNLADAIAGSADLARGKVSGHPVVVVRGLDEYVLPIAETIETDPRLGAESLARTDSSNWFPHASLESVWAALGLNLWDVQPAGLDPEPPTERAIRAADIACSDCPELELLLAQAHLTTAQLRAAVTLDLQAENEHRSTSIVNAPPPTLKIAELPVEVEQALAMRLATAVRGERLCATIQFADGRSFIAAPFDAQI